MSVFRFKRFSIRNELSAMKVNTDGVLLGAAAILRAGDRQILDVGTGTGTIAAMLCQRLADMGCEAYKVTGIDIDGPSVQEAAANFSACPWAEHLQASLCPLEDYTPAEPLDLIVSNPPYFENALQAPEERRNAARHTQGLSYRELLAFAEQHLSPEGRMSIVLPADQEDALLRCARSHSLFPLRIMRIRTTARKAPSRIIVDFSRERSSAAASEQTLTLQDSAARSKEYSALTEEFYL